MAIVILLLSALCILLAGYTALLLREVGRMTATLEEIEREETAGEVYTLVSNRYFRALACQINGMLASQREKASMVKKADRAFKESVTGISHDLRTPLTSVSGYLQMLRADQVSPQKREEYFAVIQRRLQALLILLDELFDYTRLELGQMAPQPEKLAVNSLLMEQLAMYYDDFVDKGLEPEVEVPEKPLTVFCDRGAAERVVQNLMKNALVHGRGRLQVRMWTEREQIWMDFANDAPQGTASDRLFDRFYTVDKSRSGKSTGLGLAIVKQLAEEAGGGVKAWWENGMLHVSVWFPPA